jgi:hypothetical protein
MGRSTEPQACEWIRRLNRAQMARDWKSRALDPELKQSRFPESRGWYNVSRSRARYGAATKPRGGSTNSVTKSTTSKIAA